LILIKLKIHLGGMKIAAFYFAILCKLFWKTILYGKMQKSVEKKLFSVHN